MAIIKCPECGGQVSSTASNCVHCGCKITVCPDCGRVYGGAVNICTNCGASLNGVMKITNTVKEESDKLERRFYADAKLKKTFNTISKVLEVVGALFFFAVLGYGLYKSDDLFVDFLNGEAWNYKSWQGLLTFAIIFAVLCDVLPILAEDVIDLCLTNRGVRWLKEKEIDYTNYIKSHMEITDEMTVEVALFIGNLIDVAFVLENEGEFRYNVAKISVKASCLVSAYISFIVWIVDNCNAAFAAKMLGVSYKFSFSQPAFYSAIAFLCLMVVSILIFWLIQSRRRKSWEIKKGFN